MQKLKKILQRPKAFKRLTGLEREKFLKLAEQVEERFETARVKRLNSKKRQRKIGGGQKSKLTATEALFLLLIYYRTYAQLLFLGTFFNIDESTAWRYVQRIEPLLPGIFRIPERRIKMSEEEVMELIIDATEQETQKRPGSSWSGKKNRTTIKTQIVVSSNGKVKAISKSIKGSVHDKKLYDQSKIYTDKEVKRKADLAYIGTSCQTPIKKQPGKGLTLKQKDCNQEFNRKRCGVERTIGHLKNYLILANKFRGSLNHYNLVFKNIAGLYNLQTHSV